MIDNKKAPLWPRLLGYFLAAMALFTLISRAADSIMLPQVKCARPLPGALKFTVVGQGAIQARDQWPVLGEPDLPVARVHVRQGQRVEAGDPLFTYDGEALARKVEEKAAALKKLSLQAQLDALDQQADKEKAQLKQQIARLDMGAAQYQADRLSQLQYGGATVLAPAAGTITDLLVQPGDSASGAALRLAPDSSGLVVRVALTQDQAAHLLPGAAASYLLAGDTRAREGAALAGLSPTATGYEASFDLPRDGGAVGQAATVTASQETEVYPMRVPLGAIVDTGGAKGVYRIRKGQSVLGDMEYAELVPVKVVEADGQYAAISAMLLGTDQVIYSFSKPLAAGDRVRVVS